MRAAVVQIPNECVPLSARMPAKQAWAKYVRNRWPENAVAHAQQEWSLSAGRARGLVYGQATQATIDEIRRHSRGGLGVILTVEAIALGITVDVMLHQFIETERARSQAEARKQEERDARLASLGARLAVLPSRSGSGLGR